MAQPLSSLQRVILTRALANIERKRINGLPDVYRSEIESAYYGWHYGPVIRRHPNGGRCRPDGVSLEEATRVYGKVTRAFQRLERRGLATRLLDGLRLTDAGIHAAHRERSMPDRTKSVEPPTESPQPLRPSWRRVGRLDLATLGDDWLEGLQVRPFFEEFQEMKRRQ